MFGYLVLYLGTLIHLILTLISRKKGSLRHTFLTLTFLTFTILIVLNATIWRGHEYKWNGSIFYLPCPTEITIDNQEIKVVDKIEFHIKRYIKDGFIYKEIDFEDQGQKFHFTEKVKAITLEDFETMMENAGIYLLDIFGDYKLKKFHKLESERLILIFK